MSVLGATSVVVVVVDFVFVVVAIVGVIFVVNVALLVFTDHFISR